MARLYATRFSAGASAVRFLRNLTDFSTATSVVVPSTTLGHMASTSLTNGHTSQDPTSVAAPAPPSTHSESDLSDNQAPIVNGVSSDEDAPGEEYDEDEPTVESSDSSDDVDAEGEPDGDYDSETPPPRPIAHSRTRTSTSQESQRGAKRKASDDDDFARNPELYGLRRSVRGLLRRNNYLLIIPQGRARPPRPIVGLCCTSVGYIFDRIQVEDSDDEDESESDIPRKRQRTTSRKGIALSLPSPHHSY